LELRLFDFLNFKLLLLIFLLKVDSLLPHIILYNVQQGCKLFFRVVKLVVGRVFC